MFLALGRKEIQPFGTAPQHDYLVRSVDQVVPPLPVPRANYLVARGPFAEAAERALLRAHANREFFHALMDDMHAFGVPIEGLHTETGPGVYEAAIGFSEALEQADRAILFKAGAKEIGARFGIAHGRATVMVPS